MEPERKPGDGFLGHMAHGCPGVGGGGGAVTADCPVEFVFDIWE